MTLPEQLEDHSPEEILRAVLQRLDREGMHMAAVHVSMALASIAKEEQPDGHVGARPNL